MNEIKLVNILKGRDISFMMYKLPFDVKLFNITGVNGYNIWSMTTTSTKLPDFINFDPIYKLKYLNYNPGA